MHLEGELEYIPDEEARTKFETFLSYVRSQWVDGKVSAQELSLWGKHIYTTSGQESLNRLLNDECHTAHPTFLTFRGIYSTHHSSLLKLTPCTFKTISALPFQTSSVRWRTPSSGIWRGRRSACQQNPNLSRRVTSQTMTLILTQQGEVGGLIRTWLSSSP